jgi:Flp pilus assembly pilin Flp
VLVEYALVLALVSICFIVGLKAIEVAANTALTYVGKELLNYALRNGS